MCRHQCTKQTVNTTEDRTRIQDNYLRLEKKGLKMIINKKSVNSKDQLRERKRQLHKYNKKKTKKKDRCVKQYLGGKALKSVVDHKLYDRTTMQCCYKQSKSPSQMNRSVICRTYEAINLFVSI